MKKLALVLIFALCMSGLAVEWSNLDEGHWYSGRQLEPADLIGKVVMVDQWGYYCGPCRAALPRLEEIWQTFKSKPFILLGSHTGGGEKRPQVVDAIKQFGLTYPVYESAGMVDAPSNGGAIPFIYVVDTQGKVVYSGRNDREATAAVVNALTNASGPESLLGDLQLTKFKYLQRRLQLGVSCEGSLSQLKTAAKSTSKPKDAKEAKAILDAIQRTHDNLKSAIANEIKTRPAAALDHVVAFRKTWPSEAKSLDEEFKRLTADQDVVKCAKLRQAVKKWRDYDPRTANDAKRALGTVQAQIAESTPLKESKNVGVASEAASSLEELEEIAKDLAKSAVPSKKK